MRCAYQITFALLLIGADILSAATLHINAQGNGDYPTIQAAIDAATDGDVILLADGTYRGEGNRDIDFNTKAVTLQSQNGPDDCILDCEGEVTTNEHRAFYIHRGEGANSVIDGMTIRNGYRYGVGHASGAFGGAILCTDNSSPAIMNCIFEGNYAAAGGAIYMTGSNSVISNCTFRNNTSESAVINCTYGNSPQLIDCLIYENHVSYSCGAVRSYQANPSLTGCYIANNLSDYYAGGLLFEETSVVTLTDCVIENNIAAAGDAGGVCCGNSTITLQRCFVRNNRSNSGGGGIYAGQSTVTLTNSVIAENAANAGGGLYAYASQFAMTSCTLAENLSQYNGGALYLNSASVANIQHCIFWDNLSSPPNYWGSNICAFGDGTSATIANCDAMNGEGGNLVQSSAVITWGAGNIDADPLFVGNATWDDNNTTDNILDDICLPGDYQIMPGSPCIDYTAAPAGLGDFDVVGNPRVNNTLIDRGAYESSFSGIQCTKITLRADKSRTDENPITDSLSLTGTFGGATPTIAVFNAADYCTLRVGAWSQTLATDDFLIRNGKCTYRGRAPGLTSLALDFNRGTIKASAKNIDLTGSDAPVPVAIGFGSYYGYQSLVDDGGSTDIISRKKLIPIQFMVNDTDTLRITKVRQKADNTGHIASLSIQGEIALDEPIALNTVNTNLTWGSAAFTIHSGDFDLVRDGYYRYSERGDNGFSAAATFDFNKCTFKIDVKNSDQPSQVSPTNLRLRLGSDFDQTLAGVTF